MAPACRTAASLLPGLNVDLFLLSAAEWGGGDPHLAGAWLKSGHDQTTGGARAEKDAAPPRDTSTPSGHATCPADCTASFARRWPADTGTEPCSVSPEPSGPASSTDRICACRVLSGARFLAASETSPVEMLKADPALRSRGEPRGTKACVKIDRSRSHKASPCLRALPSGDDAQHNITHTDGYQAQIVVIFEGQVSAHQSLPRDPRAPPAMGRPALCDKLAGVHSAC